MHKDCIYISIHTLLYNSVLYFYYAITYTFLHTAYYPIQLYILYLQMYQIYNGK